MNTEKVVKMRVGYYLMQFSLLGVWIHITITWTYNNYSIYTPATQQTSIWTNSELVKDREAWSMGSQTVGHGWATEQPKTPTNGHLNYFHFLLSWIMLQMNIPKKVLSISDRIYLKDIHLEDQCYENLWLY